MNCSGSTRNVVDILGPWPKLISINYFLIFAYIFFHTTCKRLFKILLKFGQF